MNDRLKELAEQAGITERWNGWNSVIPVNGDGVQSEDLERFAELIRADALEEAAKICDQLNYNGMGSLHCATAIRNRAEETE